MYKNEKDDFDERVRLLLESSESLHARLQELHAAVLAAIRAYLDGTAGQ